MTDLIIFSGQSNMQGQTERLLGDTPIDGCAEYRFLTDSLVPLKNPCGEDIRYDGTEGFAFGTPGTENWHGQMALGSTVYGYTSLVPFFCDAYRKTAPHHPCVTAVHAAKGATQLAYWMPDSEGYPMLVRKAEAAIAKTGEINRRYMIWLQGESDAIAGVKKDEYKRSLREFAYSLKARFSLDRFGIIRVGQFTMDERDFEIIRAQDELCCEDDFFLMLTTAALDFCTKEEYKHFMNPEAHGHYSAAGLCELGRLAGTALGESV